MKPKVKDDDGVEWDYDEVEYVMMMDGFRCQPTPEAKILKELRQIKKILKKR